MADGFNVVAIKVKNKRRVIPGVILGPVSRLAITERA
jgi:hypothetical protein